MDVILWGQNSALIFVVILLRNFCTETESRLHLWVSKAIIIAESLVKVAANSSSWRAGVTAGAGGSGSVMAQWHSFLGRVKSTNPWEYRRWHTSSWHATSWHATRIYKASSISDSLWNWNLRACTLYYRIQKDELEKKMKSNYYFQCMVSFDSALHVKIVNVLMKKHWWFMDPKPEQPGSSKTWAIWKHSSNFSQFSWTSAITKDHQRSS